MSAQQRGYRQWRLWVQDESRCGLLPIQRRRITARGVQPAIAAAYRFESLYLYGAVEPLTGARGIPSCAAPIRIGPDQGAP